MKKILNKKILVIASVVALAAIVSLLFINKTKEEEAKLQPIKELPLRVETTPISFDVVKNVLQCSYTNESNEDISRFSLELKFKDTGEIITVDSSEVVKAGRKSSIFSTKAPKSGKKDDVEILKYKISTLNGTYMEYDVNLKQYNWS